MEEEKNRVIITGIEIPFVDLVILLVKLALAAIPAIMILSVVFGVLSALFGGFFDLFMFRI